MNARKRNQQKYKARTLPLFRRRYYNAPGQIAYNMMVSRPLAANLVPKQNTYKLRGFYTVSSTGGGAINNGFRITQPDAFDSANALQDWTSLSNLYDEFRVTGIKLTWIPSFPNDTSATTAYRPLYVIMDTDSVGLSPTDNQCLQYDNCQIKDMSKKFTVYYRIPKLINNAGSNVSEPGWMDTASPTATGSIYLARQASLTASAAYGTVILEYYILCRIRK